MALLEPNGLAFLVRGSTYLSQPSQLQGLFVVCVGQVGLSLDRDRLAPRGSIHLLDHEVAPVDESGVFALFQRLRVCAVDQDGARPPHRLGADRLVLGIGMIQLINLIINIKTENHGQ